MRGVALAVILLSAGGCAPEPFVGTLPPYELDEPALEKRGPPVLIRSSAPRNPAPPKPAEIHLKVERLSTPDPKGRFRGLAVNLIQPEAENGRRPDAPSPYLQLLWRSDGRPIARLGRTDAVYDPESRRIRVTLRTWRSRPGSGIGMDRGLECLDHRLRYEFKVSLKDLPPGEHAYAIFEESRLENGVARSRLVSTGRIRLGGKP